MPWEGTRGVSRSSDEALLPGSAGLASAATVARLLLESEAVCALWVGADALVRRVNRCLGRLLGVAPEGVVGLTLSRLLTETDAATLQRLIPAAHGEPLVTKLLLNFVTQRQEPFTLSCWIESGGEGLHILGELPRAEEITLRDQLLELNNTLAGLARENARKGRELERARRRLEQTLADLNASYWHLKKIQEVLPICMHCGKVKTAETRWEDVVEYLHKNSLFLSHGYCPECGDLLRRRVCARRTSTASPEGASDG